MSVLDTYAPDIEMLTQAIFEHEIQAFENEYNDFLKGPIVNFELFRLKVAISTLRSGDKLNPKSYADILRNKYFKKLPLTFRKRFKYIKEEQDEIYTFLQRFKNLKTVYDDWVLLFPNLFQPIQNDYTPPERITNFLSENKEMLDKIQVHFFNKLIS